MRNFFAVIFSILLSHSAAANSVPEEFAVSSENARALGFSASLSEEPGEPKVWLVSLQFPAVVEGNLQAKRVQTYLFEKAGKEISSTSADYTVLSKSPSLLFHYRPETHDMAIVIQYGSLDSDDGSVTKAYTIESVSEYLITSQGSKGASRRDSLTAAPA
jgi:hypothetical protein